MIVPYAPAWECSRDALRRQRGRGASRTACDAERRTIVVVKMIVPYVPVGMQFATLCVVKEDAERPERHATRSAAR
ncbi:hypothetical protein BKM03_21640 [Pseudomonas avellanae]|uniref:DUF1534 domain-containing protein n=1 Tax=Pseudomonas avellanae TaxID=46257 RepID=A0AAD0M725_9PSED|nr:hypothetical protein BKM03_21640 [Pseudomonas avellanae]POP84653.1 hypothetical protein CXB34_21105 [Pseudomonas amygdali pv. morsprunorum]